MNYFMVDIELPSYISEDFVSLIPFQRQTIDNLMSEGVVVAYSLALDRSRLWVTIAAETEEEVEKIIAGFPLYKYMTPNILELIFHNSISNNFPVISLN